MDSYTTPDGRFLKVGDIIRSYHKGLFILTKITGRKKPDAPLAEFKKILNSRMEPSNGKIEQCDIGYCVPVSAQNIKDELKNIIETYEKAIDIIEKIENER